MKTAPRFSRPISSWLGGATFTTTSPLQASSAGDEGRARLLERRVGEHRGLACAALDRHLDLLRPSRFTTSGTSATRRSPAPVSLGTLTFTGPRRV